MIALEDPPLPQPTNPWLNLRPWPPLEAEADPFRRLPTSEPEPGATERQMAERARD